MKLFCQIVLIALTIAQMLSMFHQDVNGRPAKPPAGFVGVVATCIVTAIYVSLYIGAGLFN